ncbi:hypothetical protein IFM89_004397 [Coptis chinensis]|uniref:F-box associated beta-propeller type 1 domain-containing protein n=1 Tax=Coptis chinensis TaxID=261450 RepID=A0A835IKV2_9MAGN|nr:hypothetical protein IFM89_004397 [Coptis chinensis]
MITTNKTYLLDACDYWGSCNGLLCIGDKQNRQSLWNPSTREYKILPNNGPILADPYYNTFMSCIYSLRYDRWRRIKNLNYEVPNGQKGVLVNGSLHWMVSTQCSTARTASCNTLIAFDFTSEKFREVGREDYNLDGLVSTP